MDCFKAPNLPIKMIPIYATKAPEGRHVYRNKVRLELMSPGGVTCNVERSRYS
jgi:hypothetical protein